MKSLDITESYKCPYCNSNIANHIFDNSNILGESDRYERFDNSFGFEYYRNYYYQCPICKEKFYIPRRPKDVRI